MNLVNHKTFKFQFRLGFIALGIFVLSLLLFMFWSRATLFAVSIVGLLGIVAVYCFPILGTIFIAIGHATPLYANHPKLMLLAMGTTILLLYIRRVFIGNPTITIVPAMKWLLLIFAWSTFAILWAQKYDRFFPLEFLWVLLIVLTTTETIRSTHDIVFVVIAALLGGLYSSIMTFVDSYSFFVSGMAAATVVVTGGIEKIRFYGGWGGPNELGQALVPIVGLSYAILRTHSSKLLRIVIGICMVANILAIMITLSRGAMLCLAIQTGIILWAEKSRWLLSISGFVLLIVGLSFLPVDLADRLSSLFRGKSDASLSERYQIFRGGVEMIEDNFPIGVGPGNYWVNIPDYAYFRLSGITSHNTFLEVFVESGLIGLLLLIGLICSLFRAAKPNMWRFAEGDYKQNFRICMFAVLIGILVGYLFNSHLLMWTLWVPLGLICSQPLVQQTDRLIAAC